MKIKYLLLRDCVARLQNAVNASIVPVAGGVLTAAIFFGSLLGFFRPPQSASEDVVPASFSIVPARLLSPMDDSGLNDLTSPVYVQVYVDASGKVQNYEIVSGPDNENVRSQLNRKFLFTNFSPAYELGQPAPGKITISFSHINVKG